MPTDDDRRRGRESDVRPDEAPRGGRRGGGGGRRGRVRAPRRDVQVSEISHLTPQLIRIVASGRLDGWEVPVPGGHFKVAVPDGDTGEVAVRTYTVRAFDPAAQRLTIEFAIHADGPATSFAQTATPGTPFQVSGNSPRLGYRPDPETPWTVFIADHSALPAVATALDQLPGGYRAIALIEIPTVDEQLGLLTGAELELEWVMEAGTPCEQLVAAALGLDLPAGDGDIWVGCEASAMRTLRRHFLDQGTEARRLHTRAYWKTHVVNHPDHDTGDEIL